MAKLVVKEFVDEFDTETHPSESIEVRVWGRAGRQEQNFYIGSGLNFSAEANYWVEIIYTLQEAQVFYTRNFLHDASGQRDPAALEARLDEILQKGEGVFGFSDMLPETSIYLKVEKNTYSGPEGEQITYGKPELVISADIGAGLARSSPGARMIDIRLPFVELDDAARFMRELIYDLNDANQGKHPDPADLSPTANDWPFARQVNQRAYDALADDYEEFLL